MLDVEALLVQIVVVEEAALGEVSPRSIGISPTSELLKLLPWAPEGVGALPRVLTPPTVQMVLRVATVL